ncbi:MAG: four helix bundle protein [Flavobacteriales bacterium]|nr:four helix bundle protein [Flavobacteriales bacterium]
MTTRNIIHEKSFVFAVAVVKKCREISMIQKEFVISKQLLRSATSVGAMIRESSQAESKQDFIHKMAIAQKEIYETIYWLDLIVASEILKKEECHQLLNEAIEIRKIITAILVTTKRNIRSDAKNNP